MQRGFSALHIHRDHQCLTLKQLVQPPKQSGISMRQWQHASDSRPAAEAHSECAGRVYCDPQTLILKLIWHAVSQARCCMLRHSMQHRGSQTGASTSKQELQEGPGAYWAASPRKMD